MSGSRITGSAPSTWQELRNAGIRQSHFETDRRPLLLRGSTIRTLCPASASFATVPPQPRASSSGCATMTVILLCGSSNKLIPDLFYDTLLEPNYFMTATPKTPDFGAMNVVIEKLHTVRNPLRSGCKIARGTEIYPIPIMRTSTTQVRNSAYDRLILRRDRWHGEL